MEVHMCVWSINLKLYSKPAVHLLGTRARLTREANEERSCFHPCRCTPCTISLKAWVSTYPYRESICFNGSMPCFLIILYSIGAHATDADGGRCSASLCSSWSKVPQSPFQSAFPFALNFKWAQS